MLSMAKVVFLMIKILKSLIVDLTLAEIINKSLFTIMIGLNQGRLLKCDILASG